MTKLLIVMRLTWTILQKLVEVFPTYPSNLNIRYKKKIYKDK